MNYTTKDIYLSAFLIARGVTLASYIRTNGVTSFSFADRDQLDQLIREYYADHGNVSALRYGNSLKNLKNLIYSNLEYNNDNNYIHSLGAGK